MLLLEGVCDESSLISGIWRVIMCYIQHDENINSMSIYTHYEVDE